MPDLELPRTARDLVLAAVYEWHLRFPGESIHRSNLVVCCWRADPKRFGLEQLWEAHPDSNRVTVETVRLVGMGLLERTGPNTFRLTEAGLARAGAKGKQHG